MNIKNSKKFSEDSRIESAYVITVRNNKISEDMARRCIVSCNNIGMPIKVWEAFNGTTQGNVIAPKFLQNKEYIYWPKVPNCRMSSSQVAICYSHYSLWCHCITIDKPIVILEHDAIFLKPFLYHRFYNTIEFLGCVEQIQGEQLTPFIPPHGSIFDRRWRFLCRAHAYSIDPSIARQMIAHVVEQGFVKTLDVILRADIFPIVQQDIFAYDKAGQSINFEINDKPLGYGYTTEM